MTAKTLSVIASILTVILLILFGLLLTFGQVIALNGFSEREGMTSLTILLVCQGAGLILSAVFAGWLTRLLFEKFNWNKILAVIVSVVAGTILGGGLSFAALIISLFAAEGMR